MTTQNNKCIIDIFNNHAYDTSVFLNNSDTYYATITYRDLEKLYHYLNEEIEETEKNEKPEKNEEISHKKENMIFMTILNALNDSSIDLFFNFKCASNCNNGEIICNQNIQELVFDFIKYITKYNIYLIFSDHSMSALFKHWTEEKMGIVSPIYIHDNDTSGPYRMLAKKEDFIGSKHPILQKIANLSENDNIEMEFNNMNGTKIYNVNKDSKTDVKILSTGYPLNHTKNKELPVHCQFQYQNGTFIISSTHWCNMENVQSDVNLARLQVDYNNTFGIDAYNNLQKDIQTANNDATKMKRIISDSMKELCTNTPSKYMTPNKTNTKFQNKK